VASSVPVHAQPPVAPATDSATALVTHLAPAHVLGRALARFQPSTGCGPAVCPAVITTLAARGLAALRGSLAAATLLSAAAVATE
jgi:hypothetical protein